MQEKEKEKIVGEGLYFFAEEKEEEENNWRDIYIFAEERKKEESIWDRRIIFFCGGDENGGGKGKKNLEKENISCGGEEKWRFQRGKICGERNYFLAVQDSSIGDLVTH